MRYPWIGDSKVYDSFSNTKCTRIWGNSLILSSYKEDTEYLYMYVVGLLQEELWT